jgi:hypothetical protein
MYTSFVGILYSLYLKEGPEDGLILLKHVFYYIAVIYIYIYIYIYKCVMTAQSKHIIIINNMTLMFLTV